MECIAEIMGGTPALIGVDVSRNISALALSVAKEWENSLRGDIAGYGIASPIEQLFFANWVYAKLPFQLNPQWQVGKYRSDFRVDTYHYLKRRRRTDSQQFLIELDGHQFHEKTKEQVMSDKRRERDLLREGYRLIRFSGTEVTRDPMKCVWEVFETVINSIEGKNGKSES